MLSSVNVVVLHVTLLQDILFTMLHCHMLVCDMLCCFAVTSYIVKCVNYVIPVTTFVLVFPVKFEQVCSEILPVLLVF